MREGLELETLEERRLSLHLILMKQGGWGVGTGTTNR